MFRRGEGATRLDAVRWRRPGWAGLVRLGVIAGLLTTAAVTVYARQPAACPAATSADGRTPHPASVAVPAARAPVTPRPTVPSGAVGVPIRLAEPTVLAMVRPGDRVDLYAVGVGATRSGASGPAPDPARPVAAAA